MDSNMGKSHPTIDGIKQQQWLLQKGLDATAEVVSIADTGTLINMHQVVVMVLQIKPDKGEEGFITTGKTMISRNSIPPIGARVKVKYNPADPTQFVVL